jgi:hypothetical protein
MGPPPGWVGGYVPWQIVIFRTANAYGVLRSFEAFPNGLSFSLITNVLEDESGIGDPRRRRRHFFLDARLGVEFSDGRTARSDDDHHWSDETEPNQPLLRFGGGGGGGGRIQTNTSSCWLWPLPPSGPLTWVSEWEAVGAAETSVEVDAAPVLDAALRAEQIWDIEPNTVGDSSIGWTSSGTSFRRSPDKDPDASEGDSQE